MNTHDWNVNIIQQLIEKLDSHATAEENHDLLLAVLLQECEQQQKPLLWWAHHKALKTSMGQQSTGLHEHHTPQSPANQHGATVNRAP